MFNLKEEGFNKCEMKIKSITCEVKNEINKDWTREWINIKQSCIKRQRVPSVLPFSGLSLCRCLDSTARQGWRGNRRRSPSETRPLAGAEGTGRPQRSRGWHHGSVLMCTKTKATRNPSDAPLTSCRPQAAQQGYYLCSSSFGYTESSRTDVKSREKNQNLTFWLI